MEAVQEAAKLLGNPTVSARTLGRASLPRAVSGAGAKSGAAGTGSTTCAIPATCEATSRRNPMRPATIMSVPLSPSPPLCGLQIAGINSGSHPFRRRRSGDAGEWRMAAAEFNRAVHRPGCDARVYRGPGALSRRTPANLPPRARAPPHEHVGAGRGNSGGGSSAREPPIPRSMGQVGRRSA